MTFPLFDTDRYVFNLNTSFLVLSLLCTFILIMHHCGRTVWRPVEHMKWWLSSMDMLYFRKPIIKFHWSLLSMFFWFHLKNILLGDGFQIYPVYISMLLCRLFQETVKICFSIDALHLFIDNTPLFFVFAAHMKW